MVNEGKWCGKAFATSTLIDSTLLKLPCSNSVFCLPHFFDSNSIADWREHLSRLIFNETLRQTWTSCVICLGVRVKE